MWIAQIRRASFTVAYEIAETAVDGTRIEYGQASTVLAPVDMKTGRPRRLTEVELTALESFLE
jgi:acyl-CoA thioester hydrolase